MKLSKMENRITLYMGLENAEKLEKLFKEHAGVELKKDSEYMEWYQRIVWKRDSIILLDGKRIPKNGYITHNGFNSIGFGKMLKELYLKEYAK